MKIAQQGVKLFESCPARGTWIEIYLHYGLACACACRAPQGARGLKWPAAPDRVVGLAGRAPQGARGLKLPSTMVCCPIYKKAVLFQSMWIEMASGLRGGMLRKEARGLEFGVDKRSRKEG